MSFSAAGLIWMICSAGWVVIAFVTKVPEALITAIGCGAMAAVCIWVNYYE